MIRSPTLSAQQKAADAFHHYYMRDRQASHCRDLFLSIDQFPYYPSYRYHAYRSCCGALSSVLLVGILLLRVFSSLSDYVGRPPIVTEAREQFPRDSSQQHLLPRIGVQFRQNGWKPFADPRYIRVIFEQGVISMSGNVSCVHARPEACVRLSRALSRPRLIASIRVRARAKVCRSGHEGVRVCR